MATGERPPSARWHAQPAHRTAPQAMERRRRWRVRPLSTPPSTTTPTPTTSVHFSKFPANTLGKTNLNRRPLLHTRCTRSDNLTWSVWYTCVWNGVYAFNIVRQYLEPKFAARAFICALVCVCVCIYVCMCVIHPLAWVTWPFTSVRVCEFACSAGDGLHIMVLYNGSWWVCVSDLGGICLFFVVGVVMACLKFGT